MKKFLIIVSLCFISACGGSGSAAYKGLSTPSNISMVPAN
tara:strand:+ start:450 stop:569 length:120 start_codon:yes stop_codon:yes gene_type:complete